MISTLGLTGAYAAPVGTADVARSAPDPLVLFGVTTPGQAYLRELTIGAADGMRVAGWSDPDTEVRVDRARAAADLFRYDMRPERVAVYDGVRRTGYEQALSGAWDQDALNGYLDMIEAGSQIFVAIEAAGHSDYAWSTPLAAIVEVTGASYGPLRPDRQGHAVVAIAFASELNAASSLISEAVERSGEDIIPAVVVGDRFWSGWAGPEDAFVAYAEVLPTGRETSPVDAGEVSF